MKIAARSILKNSKGQIGVFVILVIVIIFAVFLSGGLSFKESGQSQQSQETVTSGGFCCDSGDGEQCKPQAGSGQTFTLQATGTEYGLLKSEITFSEPIYHLKDTGETFNGNPIILNTADGYGATTGECGQGINDQVWGTRGCVPIPNDEIIYVCKKNCVSNPSDPGGYCGSPSQPNLSCYGQADTVYDVYFKLGDYPTPGVPDVIKNCDKSSPRRLQKPIEFNRREVIIAPTEKERENLQLSTFKVIQSVQGSVPWLSPYCKPAIYLYPKEKTNANVQIAPKGKLTLTIPVYLEGGWSVTAYPSGRIDYQGSTYEYLYYEAEIPDDKIPQPKEGFVVEYGSLPTFFSSLLPKLGLNEKETAEFSSYWLKALPKSPYYYIGIVAQSTLNNIAPLTITPKPDNIIRVTLYFKALNEKEEVHPPQIVTPKRDGFTVVEWGGIVKTDKNHPFSCLM